MSPTVTYQADVPHAAGDFPPPYYYHNATSPGISTFSALDGPVVVSPGWAGRS